MVDTNNETTVEETSGEEVITTPTVEELLEELKSVKEELSSAKEELSSVKEEHHHNTELLQKVRRYEKENKKAAEAALSELNKVKELYNQKAESEAAVKNKLREITVDQVIKEIIVEAEGKSATTVFKLLDKSKFIFDEEDNLDPQSVKVQIEELKKTDPILFGKEQITPPTPARSTEGTPVAGLAQELAKCRSTKDLTDICKKYNIKTI